MTQVSIVSIYLKNGPVFQRKICYEPHETQWNLKTALNFTKNHLPTPCAKNFSLWCMQQGREEKKKKRCSYCWEAEGEWAAEDRTVKERRKDETHFQGRPWEKEAERAGRRDRKKYDWVEEAGGSFSLFFQSIFFVTPKNNTSSRLVRVRIFLTLVCSSLLWPTRQIGFVWWLRNMQGPLLHVPANKKSPWLYDAYFLSYSTWPTFRIKLKPVWYNV